MKLLVSIVVLTVVAFTVHSREIPDGQAFNVEDQGEPQMVVDHGADEGPKDVKGNTGIELRGKKDKKILTKLVDKLESLEYKLTQANLKIHKELQSIREKQNNITDTDTELKVELQSIMGNITDNQVNVTNTNSVILSKLNSISAKQVCHGIGEFRVRHQCFKVFGDKKRNWQDAQSKCKSEKLIFAEPADDTAALLRKYMLDTFGADYQSWVGARGDGSKLVWQTSGKYILKDSTLLEGGRGSSSSMATSYCLELDVLDSQWKATPASPYDVVACTTTHWTLCEVL